DRASAACPAEASVCSCPPSPWVDADALFSAVVAAVLSVPALSATESADPPFFASAATSSAPAEPASVEAPFEAVLFPAAALSSIALPPAAPLAASLPLAAL